MKETLKTVYTCFPEGRFKVLTMSYDDGCLTDKRLVEIFNKYGIKGTFHLNAGLADEVDSRISLKEVAEIYKGHEISAHTYTHPTIARCPMSLVIEQILKDRSELEKVSGYPVRGISYPNGSFSSDIIDLLPHCGIEYARNSNSTAGFKMPDNFHFWNPTCHHNKNLAELGKQFISFDKQWHLFMMYVWGHSYEFDRDNNWEVIEEFCEMAGGRDDIWYATNIEIVDYMNAAKNLKYTVDLNRVYNPSAITVWISVDGNIYSIKPGETVDI